MAQQVYNEDRRGLQFKDGEGADKLGLDGTEQFSIDLKGGDISVGAKSCASGNRGFPFQNRKARFSLKKQQNTIAVFLQNIISIQNTLYQTITLDSSLDDAFTTKHIGEKLP